jgi:hypothetical protein
VVKRALNTSEAPPRPNRLRSGATSPGRPGPAADSVIGRVRQAHVDWVRERMSSRDWQIVQEVNRVRIASGDQLERLCFVGVREGRSRTATRSRTLSRLVRWRVLVPVGRRIGGRERGSTAQVYALDAAGQRLLADDQLAAGEAVRVRRPGPPGERSLRHLLAVAELYTQLVEQARSTGLELVAFKAEPAAHWPDGRGGRLKPDAYAILARPGARDHWWIEVDLATESLPTVRAKLQAYLDFQRRGERGPEDVTPWVLVATSTERRRDAIRAMVRRLPGTDRLITVVTCAEAAGHMFGVLRE